MDLDHPEKSYGPSNNTRLVFVRITGSPSEDSFVPLSFASANTRTFLSLRINRCKPLTVDTFEPFFLHGSFQWSKKETTDNPPFNKSTLVKGIHLL